MRFVSAAFSVVAIVLICLTQPWTSTNMVWFLGSSVLCGLLAANALVMICGLY